MNKKFLSRVAALLVLTLTGLSASCGVTDTRHANNLPASGSGVGHAQTASSKPEKKVKRHKPDATAVYGTVVGVIRAPFIVAVYALSPLGYILSEGAML